MIGTPGQCDYSAANGFLDGFSELREAWRSAGLRRGQTLAFNWGPWQEGGMKLSAEWHGRLRSLMGLAPLSPEAGLKAIEAGLESGIVTKREIEKAKSNI